MSPGRGLLLGTVAVGVLDGLDAIVFFGLRSGATPDRVFKGIAAGLLGPAARQGGWPMAALGVGLHFLIAFLIVLVYFAASRVWPVLIRRAFLCGMLYGLGVYAVMNYVVVPLSAIGAPIAIAPLPVLANGLLIHMFGVGLPASLLARSAMRQ
jgi:hypothetical protein